MELSISDSGTLYNRVSTKDLDKASTDRFYKFMWQELNYTHSK